jgi:subtilisin family serine protease
LRLLLIAGLLLTVFAPVAGAQDVGPDAPPVQKSSNGVYIVQMARQPVLGNIGATGSARALNLPEGQMPDANDPTVAAYSASLERDQNAAAAAVGAEKLYSYTWTFNGFAARMTQQQAQAMTGQSGVVKVEPDAIVKRDTVSTPAFLGLSQPGGLWSQVGGPARAGEGMVVGILDSGIWPENASFADDGTFRTLPRWRGACVTGEEWDATDCSGKVIGARYFNAGFGGNDGVKSFFPYEYNSARDADGHGSHTASTAAGNYNVQASAEGADLGLISGMAPRARIAIYKVCWGRGDEGGCANSDSVAAIDQAAKDRVNVINFSISGSTTSVATPVEQAFLRASQAGVFVAVSAGNSGPTASTVAHNSPWLTTVAAGTHDRDYAATVTLGNAAVYNGKSLGSGTPSLPLISATAAGLPGADPTAVRLCFLDALDPAKVAGKIVLCDRGVNARVEKSLAVKEAGGLGVVLANTSANSVNADLHYVPTIHVDHVAGAAIKAYIAADPAAATAQISAGARVTAVAPEVAAFSSRGPALANDGNLLKPDIMAPGVDVLAAYSPAANGRDYDFLSGTSMSSPHIAGLAALIMQRQPAWTPDMVKSAMMTTAGQTLNSGSPIPGNAFGYGAGQVNPTAAVNPGLVYRARAQDYAAFMCGQGLGSLLPNPNVCKTRTVSASNLNLPSIAISRLAGQQTVTRSVTNVSGKRQTFTATAMAPGFDVKVQPSTITISPNQTVMFRVTFTRTDAPLNAYSHGALVWSNASFQVRSPIALRPVALAAPESLLGAGASGSNSFKVTFGYTGDFSAQPHGLVPATMTAGNVADDPDNTFIPGGPGTTAIMVSIPAGTELARFSLFDDYTDGEDDLDLYVFKGATQVGGSGSGTSEEEVNLVKPAAGDYTVYVHGWQTDGPDANFTLFSWAVTAAAAGNLTVTAPATATIGQQGDVTATWSGLNTGTKYLGTVTYHSVAAPAGYDDSRVGTTIVRVDTD